MEYDLFIASQVIPANIARDKNAPIYVQSNKRAMYLVIAEILDQACRKKVTQRFAENLYRVILELTFGPLAATKSEKKGRRIAGLREYRIADDAIHISTTPKPRVSHLVHLANRLRDTKLYVNVYPRLWDKSEWETVLDEVFYERPALNRIEVGSIEHHFSALLADVDEQTLEKSKPLLAKVCDYYEELRLSRKTKGPSLIYVEDDNRTSVYVDSRRLGSRVDL